MTTFFFKILHRRIRKAYRVGNTKTPFIINELVASLGLVLVLYLGLIIMLIVSIWKIFEKAGKPGWTSLIPIYNFIVLLEIIKKPTWWIIMLLIPLVNIVFLFLVYIELAIVFGQGAGFGIGLIFLSFVFLPVLAFGKSYQYIYNQQDEIGEIGRQQA